MFESPTLKKHERLTLELCQRIVEEDDRVYRNQVDFFAENFHASHISGLGLAKARLFGSLFPAYIFFLRWMDRRDGEVQRILQACSGIAAAGVATPGSQPYIDHDVLRSTSGPLLKRQFGYLANERQSGPSITPAAERPSAGFRGLLDLCHEALKDSVGEPHYTPAARQHFEVLFKGGLIGRLGATAQLAREVL